MISLVSLKVAILHRFKAHIFYPKQRYKQLRVHSFNEKTHHGLGPDQNAVGSVETPFRAFFVAILCSSPHSDLPALHRLCIRLMLLMTEKVPHQGLGVLHMNFHLSRETTCCDAT